MALSLGKGLTTMVTLVTAMVMARLLTRSELATYRQTLLAYQIAMPLLSLGMVHGIYYFMPTETKRVRGVFVDALILMFGMGTLYALFIALGGNHLLARRFSNPAIVNTLVYLVPLPIIMLPAGLLASVMVVQNQVNKLTVYNVLTNLALAAGIVFACIYWRTPEAMVVAKVAVSVIIGVIGVRLALKAVPRDDWHPRWSNMKRMVSFSIPLVAATSLGTIARQLDKIIVSAMCTPEEFAVYSNGAIEIPLIGIITGSIAAVILPDLRRMVAAEDYHNALLLFRKSAERSAVFLIPVMMFLIFSAEPFILTLFSSRYKGSITPFMLYLLILPIRVAQYGSFQTALGLNKAILLRSAVSLTVNLVLSILFVQWIGYNGAIVGTVVTLYTVNSVMNVSLISRTVGCRRRQVLPFVSMATILGVAIMAGIPIVAIDLFALNISSIIQLALNAIVYFATLICLIWLLNIQSMQTEAKNIYARLIRIFLRLPRRKGTG